MEIIYENMTIVTEDVLTEFILGTYKRYNNKMRLLLILGVILPCVLIAIIGLLESILIVIAATLGVALGGFLYFKGYILYKNKVIKNFFSLHGKSPKTLCIFYEDKLHNTTPQAKLTVNYNQITDIIETNNLYILMIERQGIMLKKDGFTIGDRNQFKSFIIEKCKHIRKR